jgi:hypothetical protein
MKLMQWRKLRTTTISNKEEVDGNEIAKEW